MNIQIIVGSVREGRIAIKIAQWVLAEIQAASLPQVKTEIVDLKVWDLPFFAGANSPMSGIYDQPKQQEWAAQVAQANAFIFISPEYNHGYSPVLKNALDYVGKEWNAKPVAFVSYGSTNGSRSIDQIRQVATQLGMIDSNATVEIRDIFKRHESDVFVANSFDQKALRSALDKLLKHVQL